MLRLVVHAPTPAALARARRNVANLLASEPDAIVELVVNGAAIDDAAAIDPADEPHLVLCENSLNWAGLAAPKGVRTVATAIGHIAHRQAEGWSYFRA